VSLPAALRPWQTARDRENTVSCDQPGLPAMGHAGPNSKRRLDPDFSGALNQATRSDANHPAGPQCCRPGRREWANRSDGPEIGDASGFVNGDSPLIVERHTGSGVGHMAAVLFRLIV
jgi:hypothetical protein